MIRLKNTVMLLVILLIAGCSTKDMDIDGTYVSDKDGNIYLIEHRIGNLFFLNDVDETAIKEILKPITEATD